MKFIVDAQLPKSLSDFLTARGFDSIHTLDLPEKNATPDSFISRIAADEKRILITKDADFLESYLLKKEPPLLLLLKTGNIRNSALLLLFDKNIDFIQELFLDHSLIEVTREEIIVHA